MSNAKPVAVDPITAEIIREGFVAITDEMKTNLMRTAYNLIIYEAQDFTVGLFDANGDTISIGLGLPMFIRGLSDAVKAKIAFYGVDGFEPGDIILTNDAYISGSHLNHMIFTAPIFHDGELVAFASSMAHWLDVGGVLGGTTTDIYAEGLQVPIVKIFKAGVQNDELTRLIAMNVRFEKLAMGDFRAQVAAILTGVHRLTAMFERYGADTVSACIEAMYVRSEALAREAVGTIPDGSYTAEAYMDDDGVNRGTPVAVKVTVVIDGDRMKIDLSGMSPQVAGYFNCGETAGRSAAQVAFTCLTSSSISPINDGILRPLEVVLPPGTVISAEKPAAMRWWMTYPMTVVDCVFRALAPVIPDRVAAGHHADLGMTQTVGFNPVSGSFFHFVGGPQGGGWGATSQADGQSATICINDGDTHNSPIEVTEAKAPEVTIAAYELRRDSGGPGRQRGGLGTRMRVRMNAPGRASAWMERTSCAPWGIEGGQAGLPNKAWLQRGDGTAEHLDSGKVDNAVLAAGDSHVIELGGGGGFGDPHDRDPELVLSDVQAGYVSAEAAKRDYRVVIIGTASALAIDEEQTRLLRNLVEEQV